MVKRRRRKKNLFLRISICTFAVYIAFTLISMQLEVAAKRRELASLNASVEQQQLTNAETERLLDLGEDEAYIEYMAHEKLGYAYPDEKIYIDRSGS
jgi:cell division protein DivIC